MIHPSSARVIDPRPRRRASRALATASPVVLAALSSLACGLEQRFVESLSQEAPRRDPVATQAGTPAAAPRTWIARGERQLIAASTGEQAVDAGLAVLDAGGNALDAALAVALDQIVLSGGSWNSLAGIGSLVYFDAHTALAYALDGSYRSFSGEREPGSIPAQGTPSGRSALVPGFPALLQAAHDRFGEFGFERLFAAAIAHARDGVVVSEALAAVFASRADVLTRLPATAAVYAPSGDLPRAGQRFVQPALAETLENFAHDGADHLYRGAWATRFVAAVRAEGGRANLDDLAAYAPEWSAPRCVLHAGSEVCSTGGRNRGGGALLESLLIAETAGAPGVFSSSADALYWNVRALQVGLLLAFAPELLPSEPFFLIDSLDGVSRSLDERLQPEAARRMVEHVTAGRWDAAAAAFSARLPSASGSPAGPARPGSHSDGVVVIDAAGNAAALIHSSNTINFGTTGLNVDGVSIPDSASFQQGALELAGPGHYLDSKLDPALVLNAGQLRLAASCIGNIHYAMFGHLRAWLAAGRPLEDTVQGPFIGGSPFLELVPPASVPAELLEAVRARGLAVREGVDQNVPIYWLGIDRPLPGAPAASTGVVTPGLVRYGGGVGGR